MTDILSTFIALLVLVAVFAGLIVWVRRDRFTGAQFVRPHVDPITLEKVQSNERAVVATRTAVLRIS